VNPRSTGVLALVALALGAFIWFYEIDGEADRKRAEEADKQLFADLGGVQPADPQDVELRTHIPAFMISELRRGFEIGFLVLLPFLVIDLIVATLIMSMGMMMMPPTIIALPFKILFFVLIDGWNLLVGALVRSFS